MINRRELFNTLLVPLVPLVATKVSAGKIGTPFIDSISVENPKGRFPGLVKIVHGVDDGKVLALYEWHHLFPKEAQEDTLTCLKGYCACGHDYLAKMMSYRLNSPEVVKGCRDPNYVPEFGFYCNPMVMKLASVTYSSPKMCNRFVF